MKNQKTLFLAEAAVMLALATVLSLVKIYEAPLGGAVTVASMLPIMYISFRHGVWRGLACAFVYSVIQLMFGLSYLACFPTPVGVIGCIMLDYIVPFTMLGFAGLFYRKNGRMPVRIAGAVAGVALACVLRFACHYFGGAVLWYEITKEQDWNSYVHTVGQWLYSFVYNISYLGPDAAIVIALSPTVPFLDDALKKALNKS